MWQRSTTKSVLDYFPALLRVDRNIFPGVERFTEAFESVEVIPLPIPADCSDGFLGAYWKRPQAYLDPLVRQSISTFSKIGNTDNQVARLKADILSGAWEKRYADLLEINELDLGYRLIIGRSHPDN